MEVILQNLCITCNIPDSTKRYQAIRKLDISSDQTYKCSMFNAGF